MRRVFLLTLTTTIALVCALAAFGAPTRSTASGTLVVDNSFTIKTSDPQRAFDPTASIIDRAIFDTLFTYKGGNLSNPIPLLVQSWKATEGAKTFTFQLKKNVHFADGKPLTSADVVFSLNRLINLKGNPSFLLDGITSVETPDALTVVFHKSDPDPAFISKGSYAVFAVLDNKTVQQHGGTSGPDAKSTDAANTA